MGTDVAPFTGEGALTCAGGGGAAINVLVHSRRQTRTTRRVLTMAALFGCKGELSVYGRIEKIAGQQYPNGG